MKKNSIHHKYVIIGAGPSGLQMGYFMKKEGMDYVILERNDTSGTFFTKQPVHRKLISINKKYNLFEEEDFNWRHDWNSLLSDDPQLRMTKYTDDFFPDADVFYRYLNDYSDKHDLNISFDTKVVKIRRVSDDGSFHIQLQDGSNITCEVLLLGLGAMNQTIPQDIEGVEQVTLYSDQTLDLEFYKNKRVAVIGGGNSAFETADYLAPSAAFVHIFVKEPPKMAWDTHFVGDIRAVNNNTFDLYQLKALHAVLNPRLRKIEKLEDGTFRTSHEYDYPNSSPPGTLKLSREYDIIINCTGWTWMKLDLFDKSAQPETKNDDTLPVLSDTWESANVENMYFIGGAMHSLDVQAASGFIHGYRYNIRSLFHLLNEKYHGKPYPSREYSPFNWNEFLDNMYERFSISPALFQLFGFLSDVVIFGEGNTSAIRYEELPVNYAKSILPADRHALILTLEFGFDKHKGSSLDFLGPSDPNDTKCATFLHPVIRHYYQGEMDEFHFGDSLLARWDRTHEAGGAVVSYHYDFQKWLIDKLGLDIELPEAEEASENFVEWSDEQIRQHKEDSMDKNTYPCSN